MPRIGTAAAFRGLVSRSREFDGCIHVAITADSVDPERVDSVEVWRDAEALNEWRKRANAPRMKKPKHSAVRRYDATAGGDGIELFTLASVPVNRYRYRGNTIPNPWTLPNRAHTAGTVESPVR